MAPSPRAQRRRIIGFAVHVVVFAAVVLHRVLHFC